MTKPTLVNNDSVHWFMSELTSSVVAKSGIPSDRYHLGKLIFESLKRYPDRVLQVDGATDLSETSASVLQRSVQCAVVMRGLGLVPGDCIVLLSSNNVDVIVPFYAALYLGLLVSAIDQRLGGNELKCSFSISKPKVVFCQNERALDVETALKDVNCDAKVITFGKRNPYVSFTQFIEQSSGTDVNEFKPSDFDVENALALLIATSGTTGLPKAAAVTYKSIVIAMPYVWNRYRQFPTPTKMILIVSSLQWMTAQMNLFCAPIFGFTRLQLSKPPSIELVTKILQKNRPTWLLMSPPFATLLFRQKKDKINKSDFASLETVEIGGSALTLELRNNIQDACSEDTEVMNGYGISEICGLGLNLGTAVGSCGKPMGCWEYRIVDIATGKHILKPNVHGELWMKGPALFKGYYRDPEATKESIVEDGWFRTGDMFYRNENDYYFFVDRIKLLLKYKYDQISPVELENVISTHPGVEEVAVTGIHDDESGDLPTACVVAKQGVTIDPDEIKELIKDNLSDSKQLRGGVIIMAALPLTGTGKVDRKKLKEIVNLKRL